MSLTDLASTFLELAGVEAPRGITGRSLDNGAAHRRPYDLAFARRPAARGPLG